MSGMHRTDESFLADRAAQDWSTTLIRSSTASPVNLDALLVDANGLAGGEPGQTIFPLPDALPVARVMDARVRPAIGVLLDDAEGRISDTETCMMATRYAALAIEKECDLIILSHQSNAGFERFGFRVERIAGQTQGQRDACREQLCRFWGIEILI